MDFQDLERLELMECRGQEGFCDEDKEALTFIDQDETEIISGRVFLVDFSEGWGKIETTEEEPDGYCFT